MLEYLKELARNTLSTYRLKPRYYGLTTCVGLVAAGFGFFVMYRAATGLAAWFGASDNAPLRAQQQGGAWVGLLILFIPAIFFATGIVVASVASLAMLRFGVLKEGEALPYALRSRYPDRWFK